MNLNDRSLVTQLQVTVCIFRLNYALHLTVEGLAVCTFFEGFCTNYRFSVSRLLSLLLYFRHFDDVTNMVATTCQMLFHLVQNNNFHCQTLYKIYWKNAKFDLFGSEKASCQIWLRTEIG